MTRFMKGKSNSNIEVPLGVYLRRDIDGFARIVETVG
jgi:anionic cell wall polymer biosynthesis LytR-Cps2A-Psr (LCP) family protein